MSGLLTENKQVSKECCMGMGGWLSGDCCSAMKMLSESLSSGLGKGLLQSCRS